MIKTIISNIRMKNAMFSLKNKSNAEAKKISFFPRVEFAGEEAGEAGYVLALRLKP